MSLFTACSDDDPDYTTVINEEIAGNYKGTLGVSINGQAVAQGMPQRITVSGANATSINLSLTNFSFSGIQVGDVSLENCPMACWLLKHKPVIAKSHPTFLIFIRVIFLYAYSGFVANIIFELKRKGFVHWLWTKS